MKNNELLIERIRFILSKQEGLFSEKKMFGTVCFMLNGNICVGAWKGSLLIRCDKKKYDEILTEPYTNPAKLGSQITKGWVLVDPDGIESEDDLKAWIKRAIKYTNSLPSKWFPSEPSSK